MVDLSIAMLNYQRVHDGYLADIDHAVKTAWHLMDLMDLMVQHATRRATRSFRASLTWFWAPATLRGIINPIGSMVLLYMVTFTINIPPMLAYIPIYHTWILWEWSSFQAGGQISLKHVETIRSVTFTTLSPTYNTYVCIHICIYW